MASRAQSKTRSTATTPARAARTLRVQIGTIVASEVPDLDRLGECFESLRDLTELPTRLFAIAVEEAAALDTIYARHRDSNVLHAAISAHRRVLEGEGRSARIPGVTQSIESIERLLRSTAGRRLSALQRHEVRCALVKGHLLAGDRASARRSIERIARDTIDLPTRGGVREASRDSVCSRGFELALEDHDHADALRWASRLCDLRSTNRAAHASGAYADALAPMTSLCLEVGQLTRAAESAASWIAAERIALARGAERPSRLLDALQNAALATSVLAGGDNASSIERDSALSAARAFTDAAIASFEESLDEARVFAAARASDAIAGETTLATNVESDDTARLETLLAYAMAIADPALVVHVRLARLARATAVSDWPSVASWTDDLLREMAETPPELLALAVRAQFAVGHDTRCASLAVDYLAKAGSESDPAEVATVISLGSESHAREFDRADPLGQDELATQRLASIHAIDHRLSQIRALARSVALRATLLASRALAQQQAGLPGLAQRDAQEALSKTRRARTLPTEAAAFIAYVHERVATADKRQRVDLASLDPVNASARALAAAERNDTTRAASLLVHLSLPTLASQPAALANVLAALTRTLERLSPDDRLLEEGLAAWHDLSVWATLPSARGSVQVRGRIALLRMPLTPRDAAGER